MAIMAPILRSDEGSEGLIHGEEVTIADSQGRGRTETRTGEAEGRRAAALA